MTRWRIAWTLWSWVTWPWEVRQLRRMGAVRTGWMTWELPGNLPWSSPAADPIEDLRQAMTGIQQAHRHD